MRARVVLFCSPIPRHRLLAVSTSQFSLIGFHGFHAILCCALQSHTTASFVIFLCLPLTTCTRSMHPSAEQHSLDFHKLTLFIAGTKQACMFRDQYTALTATGFSIYGLSKDSPKANTTFKTKQNLPYALLCDTDATLISAVGLKKAPSSTSRGVFVVDKSGKILAAEPGSPAGM